MYLWSHFLRPNAFLCEMVLWAGPLFPWQSQWPLLVIAAVPDSMLEARTPCHEDSTLLQLKKTWGQPRSVGERIEPGEMLNATLTSILIFIWCGAIILPLSKRAAHLAQPEDIRSGFMRFVLHHSIPPSQTLSRKGCTFQPWSVFTWWLKVPFYPVTASSKQIISFSPMAKEHTAVCMFG